MWDRVGDTSGSRSMNGRAGDETPWKSRGGFGYRVRQASAKPSNTTNEDLLSDSRYVGAVLRFLEGTMVGCVKEGAITRGDWMY